MRFSLWLLFMRSRFNILLHVVIQFHVPKYKFSLKNKFKMLGVFSLIFVEDIKISFRYDFVAPLNWLSLTFIFEMLFWFMLRHEEKEKQKGWRPLNTNKWLVH